MSALVFNHIAIKFDEADFMPGHYKKDYQELYVSLRNVTGSLFFLGANVFTGLVFASIMSLQLERAVLLRELSSKCYGLPAYFISKSLFEFPLMMVFPLITQLITFWFAPYGSYNLDTNTFLKFYLVLLLTA